MNKEKCSDSTDTSTWLYSSWSLHTIFARDYKSVVSLGALENHATQAYLSSDMLDAWEGETDFVMCTEPIAA